MKQNKLTAEQALAKKPAFQVYSNNQYVVNAVDDFEEEDEEDYEVWAKQEREETAKELRSLRIEKGLSQTAIAIGIGSSPTSICNFEKGRYLTRWDMIAKSYKMFLDIKGLKEVHNAKGQPSPSKETDVDAIAKRLADTTTDFIKQLYEQQKTIDELKYKIAEALSQSI